MAEVRLSVGAVLGLAHATLDLGLQLRVLQGSRELSSPNLKESFVPTKHPQVLTVAAKIHDASAQPVTVNLQRFQEGSVVGHKAFERIAVPSTRRPASSCPVGDAHEISLAARRWATRPLSVEPPPGLARLGIGAGGVTCQSYARSSAPLREVTGRPGAHHVCQYLAETLMEST